MASTLRVQARPALRRKGFVTRKDVIGYLFIGPWILGFIAFTMIPFLTSIYLSMTDYDLITARFVGLNNFRVIFTEDPKFRRTLFNTVYYLVFHVPGVQIVSLSLALLLNQELRGISIFRTIFYLPSLVSGVGTAFLWRFIFGGQSGLVNSILAMIGIQGPNWFNDLTWSMPALIMMSLWGAGSSMIIYLAGLQGIPTHLYEACEIDGGTFWHKFWNITIPLLTPTIFYTMIMGVIGSFQVFTAAYLITAGGPIDRTLFYMLYLYRQAFLSFKMGYAAALAWILFIIILAFTLLQTLLARRWVYYEAGARGRIL